ncbi:hypothetical protein ACFOZ7_01825 [Natribaculum luteum]|uniref:Uncharacterized protein n=1 Tax=Natribaculum luteum TaxID=1586232 RepID=A0ABD5NUP6_9EURY|nr:hypothetical protein [Natribaculum luteum]
MTLRDHLQNQRPQYILLWALAVTFVVLALAGIPLFGLEPTMLAILAAVFAALTAEYSRQETCNST